MLESHKQYIRSDINEDEDVRGHFNDVTRLIELVNEKPEDITHQDFVLMIDIICEHVLKNKKALVNKYFESQDNILDVSDKLCKQFINNFTRKNCIYECGTYKFILLDVIYTTDSVLKENSITVGQEMVDKIIDDDLTPVHQPKMMKLIDMSNDVLIIHANPSKEG